MRVMSQQALEDHLRSGLPHLTEADLRALMPIVERLLEAYQSERIYTLWRESSGRLWRIPL